jgi:hypothetical protein
MRAAYDEVRATGIKRRHEPPRIVGDLSIATLGTVRNFVRRLGMMGAKEPSNAATQRATYS